ncbi:MAG TPA: efflux transporter outer membrane subunit [Vicinamibacterales bacterium]|nr:efflux transporter outer membrane subunit [Vicinamibacterales bacterium]
MTTCSRLFVPVVAPVVVLAVAGCTVGPKYRRPEVAVPSMYRAADPGHTEATSLGDAKWWEVFQDQQLQDLMRTALQQNYDVRIAATRILQARAQLGITRADQFPTVTGGASATEQRFASSTLAPGFPGFQFGLFDLNASASWVVDFWGQYRRATESARASLLASEWGRRSVISTLVSNLASAYFQLRELDLELEISRRTLASRRESLRLTRIQADRGATSLLDVRQSEQLVYTASAQIPDLERRIEQQENQISVLLGRNPGPVTRGRALTEQPHAPEIPAGLPSALLARRPDILQAEEQLIAQNAQIGVARAAFWPQITLTAQGGTESAALTGLFSGPSGLWSFAANLTQPIFNAGRLRSKVRLAEAQQQQASLTYQQTIQTAFREVSDALIGYRKSREVREEQMLLTEAARSASQLSDMRYRGGVASYLEVLTNETNYFSAQLNLTQAQLNELQTLVQLYNALGGGWQDQ